MFNLLAPKRKLINNIIFILSCFIVYGTLILASEIKCQNSNRKNYCKPLNFITSPSKIVFKGITRFHILYQSRNQPEVFRNLFKDGYLSGMIARKDIIPLNERFNYLESGFNFFYEKNSRPEAGYILISKGDPNNNGFPVIELWDLNNQKSIYNWNLNEVVKYTKRENDRNVIIFRHPVIGNDGELIFNTQNSKLIKIDKNGKILQVNQDLKFHHSINLDSNGNIYACIADDNGNEGYAILDKNLKIVELHYLEDIYAEHGLLPRIYSTNSSDPTHLNDVEPILSSNSYKKTTDLVLLSLRSTSSLILYNQENRKIVTIFDGLVSQQHDIDVINLDPLRISIFDNNVQRDNKRINFDNVSENNISYGNKIIFLENFNTDLNQGKLINLYSPNSKEYKNSGVIKNELNFSKLDFHRRPRTISAGLSEYNKSSNSLIIEESNFGRIFEYDLIKEKINWTFLNSDKKKSTFWRLSWSRFYPENPLKNQ